MTGPAMGSIAQRKSRVLTRMKDAAFNLHQAAERAYICFLLVHTFNFFRALTTSSS